MKKYKVLIILIAAMAVMFAAAYVVYDTYGGLMTVQPPGLSTSEPDRPSGEDDADDAPGKDTEDDSAVSGGPNDPGSGNTAAGPDGPGSAGRSSAGQDGGNGTEKTVPDADGNTGENGADKNTAGQVLQDDDGYRIMVPDFTLNDLDGNKISLSDYTGKTVILNFWATWCVYCGEEIRGLNSLDKELKESGDTVILAINTEEPYDTVREFVEKNDLDLTVLLDENGDVSVGLFGVVSVPNTFIVSSDGSLYVYIPGRIGIDLMRELIDRARNNEPLPDAR